MNWIQKAARRDSAEANVRRALERIDSSAPSGGSRSYTTDGYKEALASLHLAVRDLQASEGGE